MKLQLSKAELLQIIREEAVKSTEKYDDDSALKGDQDELPDALQKGIIDKAKKNELDEYDEYDEIDESMIRITREDFINMLREEISLAKEQPTQLDGDGLADVISDILGDMGGDEPMQMGTGGRARMAKQQLQHIASNAQSLHDTLSDDDELPEWTQSKIAVAEAGIDAVHDHLSYKMDVKESRKKKVRNILAEQDDEKMSSGDFMKAMKGGLTDMMKVVPDDKNDELMNAIKALGAASKFDASSFKTVVSLIMDKTAAAQKKAEGASK